MTAPTPAQNLAAFDALLTDCPVLPRGFLAGEIAPGELEVLRVEAQAAERRLATEPAEVAEPIRSALRAFRSVRTMHGLAQIFTVYERRMEAYQAAHGGSIDAMMDPLFIFTYENAYARQRIREASPFS